MIGALGIIGVAASALGEIQALQSVALTAQKIVHDMLSNGKSEPDPEMMKQLDEQIRASSIGRRQTSGQYDRMIEEIKNGTFQPTNLNL